MEATQVKIDHDVAKQGQYIHDDKAFLFSLTGRNPVRYPVTNAQYAVKMHNTTGPYFGEDLRFMNANTVTVISAPGNHYNFNAAEMHGNNLNLTECEVYKVEGECRINSLLSLMCIFYCACYYDYYFFNRRW